MVLIKKIFLFLILAIALLFSVDSILAQTPTITPEPAKTSDSSSISEVSDCKENKISIAECPAFMQKLLDGAIAKKNSYESQIEVRENQIKLTEARIESTRAELLSLAADIDTADKKIVNLEKNLSGFTKVLANRIAATYKVGGTQSFEILVASNDISNFFTRLNYLRIAQIHDKELIYDTQQAKMDYANQKNIFENKKKKVESLKKQLEVYTAQLDEEKENLQRLLTETQGIAENYQRLLAQARAELAGYSSFVTAAGGGLTTFGSGSNGWYYTQRDPQWGNMVLPGSSSTVLLAGCAVTSVSMVCKSYGQSVTPASIVSDQNKFIGGDLWNWAFACDGKTTNWIGSSKDQVKSYVESGKPVILRLVAPSVSGLHFIVAWKSDGDDFIIHDPYYGPDKKFSDRYDWSQVTTAIVIN